jgi:hypothetical protein
MSIRLARLVAADLISVLLLIGLSAGCSSSEKASVVDMSVVLERGTGCEWIDEFRIIADAPFDQTFSGRFETDRAELQWTYMPPEAEFDLELQLIGASKTYSYSPTLAKPWGNTAVFSITCDDMTEKPAVVLDLNPFNGVITVPAACRWFSEAQLLEEYEINADTGQPMLSRLFTTDLAGGRSVFYWHAPQFVDPVVVVDMHIPGRGDDGGDLVHRFRFPVELAWGNRFDFNVICGEKVQDVSMQLVVGGETYDPTPFGEDGDADGDLDRVDGDAPDGDVVDGDRDSVDGDAADGDVIDGDLVDGDVTDGDATDGDVVDGDVVDGDVELDDEICGDENPNIYNSVEAEEIFRKMDSSPVEQARVVNTSGAFEEDGDIDLDDETEAADTIELDDVETETPYENPNISGGAYVRLDATEAGGELVFEINLPSEWEYRFHINFVSGKNTWGQVSLFVDDAVDPIPLQNGSTVKDLKTATTGMYEEWPTSLVSYSPICLRGGTHLLRVRVVGTSGTGYTIGVDRIGYSSN